MNRVTTDTGFCSVTTGILFTIGTKQETADKQMSITVDQKNNSKNLEKQKPYVIAQLHKSTFLKEKTGIYLETERILLKTVLYYIILYYNKILHINVLLFF